MYYFNHKLYVIEGFNGMLYVFSFHLLSFIVILNDYYVNVTKSIGQPDLLDVNEDIEDVFLAHESHESVQYIRQYMKDQNGSNNTFTFSHVTMNDVLKELRSINIRKTTGCDLIPGKLIKEGADFLCKPI